MIGGSAARAREHRHATDMLPPRSTSSERPAQALLERFACSAFPLSSAKKREHVEFLLPC
jgi:hypothetical protein